MTDNFSSLTGGFQLTFRCLDYSSQERSQYFGTDIGSGLVITFVLFHMNPNFPNIIQTRAEILQMLQKIETGSTKSLKVYLKHVDFCKCKVRITLLRTASASMEILRLQIWRHECVPAGLEQKLVQHCSSSLRSPRRTPKIGTLPLCPFQSPDRASGA